MTKVTTTYERWFRGLTGATGTGRRLLCFPHAGGSAAAFRPLGRALDGIVEVAAVQYPGRQDRLAEDVVTDLHVLADRVAAALRAEGREGPQVFLGHSMGAVVAYEVAVRLAGCGGPAALLVAGRGAPGAPARIPVPDDDAGLVALLGRLGGTDMSLLENEDVRDLVLPAVRGDYRAVRDYRARPAVPLRCPVVALTGDADPACGPEDAAGWASHTTAGFELVVSPGGHFFLHDDVAATARVVRDRLATSPA